MDQPIVARLETFDGFTYTVKIGNKTNDDNYYLNASVAADLPKDRTAGKDEKPEDKEKLDKEFKEKVSKLEEKLKQEKAYAKWTYLVSKWTVDPLLKERKDLLLEKKEETKQQTPTQTNTVSEPKKEATKVLAPGTPPPLPPIPPAVEPKKDEKPAEHKPDK